MIKAPYGFKYNVVLKDEEDYVVAEHPVDNLKAAKVEMAYLLSHEYAVSAESTQEFLGVRAEVYNAKGECVLDLVR